jgi:hypothetical protein
LRTFALCRHGQRSACSVEASSLHAFEGLVVRLQWNTAERGAAHLRLAFRGGVWPICLKA